MGWERNREKGIFVQTVGRQSLGSEGGGGALELSACCAEKSFGWEDGGGRAQTPPVCFWNAKLVQ